MKEKKLKERGKSKDKEERRIKEEKAKTRRKEVVKGSRKRPILGTACIWQVHVLILCCEIANPPTNSMA